MFSYPDAAKILKASLQNPVSAPLDGASIDTRKIQRGNIFIAIHGEKQDGHDYLEQAFTQGASGAIVSAAWLNLHTDILKNPRIQ